MMIRRFAKRLLGIIVIIRKKLLTNGLILPLTTYVTKESTFGGYNSIGANCYIDGEIGAFSYTGANCELKSVKVGRFCSIASSVKVLRNTHPSSKYVSTSPVFYSTLGQCGGKSFVTRRLFDVRVLAEGSTRFSCIIGNDVWIDENVIIMGG